MWEQADQLPIVQQKGCARMLTASGQTNGPCNGHAYSPLGHATNLCNSNDMLYIMYVCM